MARTDNDTWDLASSVGATATMVAAARAVASRADRPVINDPFAEPLVRAVGADFFTDLATGELTPAELDVRDGAQSPVGISRFADGMAARTRFFDEFFADAVAAGIRQAVIVASGLDARGYRLEWPGDMVRVEIDQPEVIGFQKTTRGGLGAQPSTELRTVAIDLRQDWPAALAEAGFDAARPTAWIAEGLFGYLPPEAQDRLLENITGLSGPGSRLATEHMDPKALTGDWAREFSERGRRYGSDIDLTALFYSGPRRSAGDHLRALGWRVRAIPSRDAYAANGFEPPADPLGTMVGDSGYLSAQLG